MKINYLFFTVVLMFTASVLQAQNQRAKVVEAPYTVNIYTVTGTGGKGTLITANSSLAANTVYYVEVSTATTSPAIATLRVTNADGFECGLWSGGFVPYANPTGAQGDGSSFAFRIRTFSGIDFFTPLYLKASQCSSGCANPGGTGWNTIKPILFPQP